MIAKEKSCDQHVFRTCRDYRAALALVSAAGSYPGIKAGGVATSPLQAALENFTRIWLPQNFSISRYSNGTWAVLYTAEAEETTHAEVGYHLQEYHIPSKSVGVDMVVPCLTYHLQISGPMRSYTHLLHERQNLCETSSIGYARCHLLASEASKDGVAVLQVFSARDVNGVCCPVLERRSSSDPLASKEVEIILSDSWGDVTVRDVGLKVCHISR